MQKTHEQQSFLKTLFTARFSWQAHHNENSREIPEHPYFRSRYPVVSAGTIPATMTPFAGRESPNGKQGEIYRERYRVWPGGTFFRIRAGICISGRSFLRSCTG
jgi:hypothetical protein